MAEQEELGNVAASANATASAANPEVGEGNEQYDPAKDPKRRAKSKDPGWQYGFWPDLGNKDKVQCKLCGVIVSSGIKRLKQHLAGGFGDVEKCSKTTTAIMREMHDYLKSSARNKPINYDDDDVEEGQEAQGVAQEVEEVEVEQEQQQGTSTVQSSKGSWSWTAPKLTPSSGTATKRKLAAAALQSKNTNKKSCVAAGSKSVVAMLRKLPHEVVEERHSRGKKQTYMEQFNSKVSKEDKERCNEYIADFFYSNGIPFNVVKSRSFEVMVEAIGQIGSNHIGPSYHELRKPYLQKAKMKIDVLRKTHELAWKEYGCSIMSDGWTDKRGRHLINFLANSPEGTFFLESVDASSQVADATMLADLLQKRIEEVGEKNVVQVITDNGANFKAAGRHLMARFPTLFWTPCAAHCIDLMLEEIGKIPVLNTCITKAKRVTTFIYRHGKLLDTMRDKTGGYDLVRPAATRFATSFLTLQSLFKHRAALRNLFVDEDWSRCKLAKSQVGKNVEEIVLSTNFWNAVQDCKRATQPLVVVLRIVDGDEKPALPEVLIAMDVAKQKIKEALQGKAILDRVIDIIERRWRDQMEVKLYGAALYLNPNKFYAFKEKESARARKLRDNFNDVLSKMVGQEDEALATKIATQANHYEKKRACFGKALAISSQSKMTPLDWWDSFGGDASELQQFAKRLLGLCASASGCERNWSTFEFMHTKKRNRLEHQRLSDLVYVKYNQKIAERFQKMRVEGSNFNPLIFDDYEWNTDWIDAGAEDVHDAEPENLDWALIDEVVGASSALRGRNLPRKTYASRSDVRTYHRRGHGGASTSSLHLEEEGQSNDDHDEDVELDDEDIEDDYGEAPPSPTLNTAGAGQSDSAGDEGGDSDYDC